MIHYTRFLVGCVCCKRDAANAGGVAPGAGAPLWLFLWFVYPFHMSGYDQKYILTCHVRHKMPCWAHQRQLSYQPKQGKEFTQHLERTLDDWGDWDANDPAPSSEDLSVGVKPEE